VKNIFQSMGNARGFRAKALRACQAVILIWSAHCLTAEDQGIPPEEANVQILSAYAAKDLECGQQHVLTIPVTNRADRRSVDACVLNILAVDCAVWGSESNLPEACLAILVQL